MSEFKNLQNTIKVNGEDFNINAVHSDSASKVDNKLTIEQKGNSVQGRKTIEFDGTAQKSVSVVPSEGGTFSGPVFIENIALENAQPNQVLTYTNIEHLTEQLTGFSCYSWDGTSLSPKNQSNEPLGKASLVIGPANYIDLLQTYMNNNQIEGTPTYCLYLSSTSPYSIYLCSKKETIQLVRTTEKLISAINPIEWTADSINDKFNALISADRAINTDLANLELLVNAISGNASSDNVAINLIEIKNKLEQNETKIENIINGTDGTVVEHATNADFSTNATNATKASFDNTSYSYTIDKGYYRSTANTVTANNAYANTITISATEPSVANPGDIWIKIPSA